MSHNDNHPSAQSHQLVEHSKIDDSTRSDSVLIAVPARDDKRVEVYQFPEERLRFIVPRAQSTDTGKSVQLHVQLAMPQAFPQHDAHDISCF
ncbi:hypothetical protein IAQ61_003854 [Plenodomus lingam]|uniref:uncharacterized protein n=1 Tax=Leptosphaeria maculans TaxID=5022 RepID=UPI00332E6DB1|nr:hypothetical protein IAQ61_003854 [Plenodomus lingam]